MNQLAPAPEERLYERIAAILDEARSRVARTVNTAMVHAYWLIGREIVEVEQGGKERAGYGDELIRGLAVKLTRRFGKGFSAPNLRNMRQFYLTFPEGSAVPEDLGGPRKGSAVPSNSDEETIRLAVPSKSPLPEDNAQILAARYQMYLPTEEELRAEITREREEAERVLALTQDTTKRSRRGE